MSASGSSADFVSVACAVTRPKTGRSSGYSIRRDSVPVKYQGGDLSGLLHARYINYDIMMMSKREKHGNLPFFLRDLFIQVTYIQDPNGIYFRVLFDSFSGSYSLIKPWSVVSLIIREAIG